ncbi:hypothetical protein ACFVIM_33585 [Streptomyces sp. NPDC057638]|uniref:hypothetical protein n=1 Tax=Streptomyces sp. NPDC057638 TaxID=3346190 RepID=UPI0036A77078
MSLALLLTTAATTVVGAAALYAVHGLRRQIVALRAELSRAAARPTVPRARPTPAAEIRAAVADALAEERERELADARAFWAAQETRDDAEGTAAAPFAEELPYYVPRQADLVGLEALEPLHQLDHRDPHRELDRLAPLSPLDGLAPEPQGALDPLPDRGEWPAPLDRADPAERVDHTHRTDRPDPGNLTGLAGLPEATEYTADSPELAAARRRHPSHPDFTPVPSPVITDHERTVAKLEHLADERTELADVRPGPLGTLDVYVFADGTTLCMTPGHRETAERLAHALRSGDTPVLLGGSGVAGAYALTFSCGDETVYLLADRVIASL